MSQPYEPASWLEGYLLMAAHFEEMVFLNPPFAAHRKAEGLGQLDNPALFPGTQMIRMEAR